MKTDIDVATNDDFGDSDHYADTIELSLLDDDSEIDGDCNESQPCRGDEPWLTQDLPEDIK